MCPQNSILEQQPIGSIIGQADMARNQEIFHSGVRNVPDLVGYSHSSFFSTAMNDAKKMKPKILVQIRPWKDVSLITCRKVPRTNNGHRNHVTFSKIS
jgi:hypothetical protein